MRVILLLSTCFVIWAQSPTLRMQRLGLEDGLSQSSVFCALEDHLGFLWFGTANGLNRFDGYAFQVFNHDPKRPGSLSNDWIFDMDEDAQGHLWVGTRAGINHFNRANGAFTQYLDGQVTAVLVDQAGAVWAGTTQGLFVRRSSDSVFTSIPIGWESGLYTAHPQIRALAESTDRALWVGTPGGLHRFNAERSHTSWMGRIPYPLSLRYPALIQDLDLNRDSAIAQLAGEQTETTPFTLDQGASVMVVAVGEGVRDMFDWAELSTAAGDPVWKMRIENTRHAGGVAKNRVELAFLSLPAGTYHLTWRADDSHHRGAFNRPPPDSPWRHHWGVALFPISPQLAALEQAAHGAVQPEQIGANSISSIYPDGADGALWVGTFGGGASLFKNGQLVRQLQAQGGPERHQYRQEVAEAFADRLAQVPLARAQLRHDDQRSEFDFVVDRAVDVLVVAVGEGVSKMSDRCWIARGLDIPWRMSYERSCHAGGSLKNRVQMEVVRLAPGSYVAHAESDDSHAPQRWNAEPPNRLWPYGLSIYSLNQAESQWWTLALEERDQPELPSPIVKCIERDPAGRLWVGTNAGLAILDRDRVDHQLHDPADPLSLLSDDVQALVSDHAGNMWIGTVLGGINKLTQLKQTFHTVTPRPDQMRTPLVYGFGERPDGRVWIGSNRGLYLYDPNEFKFVTIDWPCEDSACLDDRIGVIHEASHDAVWLGTQRGIFKLSVHDEADRLVVDQMVEVGLGEDPQRGSLKPQVSAFESLGDDLLVGTLGAGLWLLDANDKAHAIELDHPTVSCIMTDTQSQVWVGTAGGGVYVGSLTTPFVPLSDGLSSKIVSCLAEDQRGQIWVGTYGAGLNRFNAETQTYTNFTSEDGLANNVVYGMLRHDRYLWISSNKGVSRFEPETHRFVHYTVTDGLQSNEFNTGAYRTLSANRLIFGGVSGFTFFDPGQIQHNETAPRTVLTAITVAGQALNQNRPLDEVQNVEIRHSDTVVGFEFVAMDFTNPALNHFRYRMLGLNAEWSSASTRRFVSYSHLKPGHYQFEVKSSNSDGVWDPQGRHVQLRVLPPVWATWWFRLVAGGLIVAVIALIGSQRWLRMRHEQSIRDAFSKELIDSRERERRHLAVELHDGLGQSLMAVRTDLMRYLAKRPEAAAELGDLPDYVMHAIDETRTISHQLHPHALDRLGFVKAIEAVVEKARHTTDTEIQCHLEGWPTLHRDLEIHLYRIVQESLNNIAKHAQATLATITGTAGQNRLQLEIRDNGRGFDPSKQGSGLGLTGMSQRIRLLGGKFVVKSVLGMGTHISISLKITAPEA